ncbi:MAG: NUDIX hydrolase [Chloroflexota bacterium]
MPAFTYCPNCAVPLPVPPNEPGTPRVCANCGATHYHNSKPAAGALILRGDRILLVERAVEPFKGYWDIPGGFLELGEHPADGARREALEETGLLVEVADPPFAILMDRYGDSDDRTLNLYYLARVIGGDPHPADDAAALRWFPLSALPDRIAFDHCVELLSRLAASRRGSS